MDRLKYQIGISEKLQAASPPLLKFPISAPFLAFSITEGSWSWLFYTVYIYLCNRCCSQCDKLVRIRDQGTGSDSPWSQWGHPQQNEIIVPATGFIPRTFWSHAQFKHTEPHNTMTQKSKRPAQEQCTFTGKSNVMTVFRSVFTTNQLCGRQNNNIDCFEGYIPLNIQQGFKWRHGCLCLSAVII